MASKIYASWAHGCAAVPERSHTRVLREGFGATFTIPANQGEWIHLPIPTPVIVESDRANINQVTVLFHARGDSAVKGLRVHDGSAEILAKDYLNVDGDHSQGLDQLNTFRVNRSNILWGISVSLFVSAGRLESEFFVKSFGADFVHALS